jgi:hypothetical protein
MTTAITLLQNRDLRLTGPFGLRDSRKVLAFRRYMHTHTMEISPESFPYIPFFLLGLNKLSHNFL